MTTEPASSALAPAQARLRFRQGLSTPTSGWADGYTQCNLLTIPADHADDFLLFATRNSRACPVIDVTEPGSFRTSLAPDADLRTDLPGYRVFRDGALAEETTDVVAHWSGDLVSFLIGCSFTFERALLAAGVPVRHATAGRNVPMYRTSLRTEPAGVFHGPKVVSMRSIPADLVARAVDVTARFPKMHGAPVHIGDPEAIGIRDVDLPDYGDEPVTEPGDVPVFWECGVTPQAAVIAARIPFAISHAPGRMFITDVDDSRWTE